MPFNLLQVFKKGIMSLIHKYVKGDTPLLLAIRSMKGQVVEILLENHADVNKTNYRKKSPLHAAVKSSVEPKKY